MTQLLNLPKSGGSFTRDKDGKNLKQVQKPTADHPEGNRARKAAKPTQPTEPTQPNQSTTDSKSLKEKPNAAV